MRVVTWNCKGAFHRKISHASALSPDILIVPESEHIDSVQTDLGDKIPTSVVWQGHTPRKGLAVIAYGDYHVQLHPRYTADHRWVLPIIVSGPVSFLLLAVWTLPIKETGSYVQPLFQAHESYQDIFHDFPVMWAGDFNANFIFDRPSRRYKFRDFVRLLEESDIVSLYHSQTDALNGGETDETFFLYHHRDKGYHIDYIFTCRALRENGFHITVGKPDQWLDKSDHLPVICDIDTTKPNKAEQTDAGNRRSAGA